MHRRKCRRNANFLNRHRHLSLFLQELHFRFDCTAKIPSKQTFWHVPHDEIAQAVAILRLRARRRLMMGELLFMQCLLQHFRRCRLRTCGLLFAVTSLNSLADPVVFRDRAMLMRGCRYRKTDSRPHRRRKSDSLFRPSEILSSETAWHHRSQPSPSGPKAAPGARPRPTSRTRRCANSRDLP